VHRSGLSRPGLLWDDGHVAQGFAWSDGIVSFGVPDHDRQCLVRVETSKTLSVEAAALWALQTPFSVDASPLKIGTIGNMRNVDVPAGKYDLIFHALPGEAVGNYAFLLKLSFVPTETPDFRILKQGDELTTDHVLRRDAQRA
jgi:hypothetical protein